MDKKDKKRFTISIFLSEKDVKILNSLKGGFTENINKLLQEGIANVEKRKQ